MASRHRLTTVPPAEFTKARDLLVQELRKAGEEEEARRTAALRKPSVALWVTNQLGKDARTDVDALIDAAQKLKRAHASGDADGLRHAMREQREALQGLTRVAAGLAQKIGARATPELERRVQDTAQTAASTDPQGLREGTLAQELSPAGFDALLGTKVAPARPPAAADKGRDQRREQEFAARELHAAEQTAHRLAAEAKEAELAAAASQRSAEKARAHAEEARKRADAAAAHALELRKRE